MYIRTFQLVPRSRAGNVALLAAVVGLGAVLVVFGLALLLTLAAVGAVAGIATLAWRRLTGRRPAVAPPERTFVLDPRLEIPASAAHVHAEHLERAERAERAGSTGRAALPPAVDE